MGIRGHIQTTQPSYDNGACFSSWVSEYALNFLKENDIYVWDNDGNGDTWEIEIDDKLITLASDLCEGRIDFESKLEGTEMASQGYSKEFGEFLKVGIDVANQKGYTTIRIDWF